MQPARQLILEFGVKREFLVALTVLSVVVLMGIPVATGWRIAFNSLLRDPTPQVKLFFWMMSTLFIVETQPYQSHQNRAII